ncbi:serine/threonine protein kinase [Mycobacterium sp. 663a-19]|uniref:serine/threonine protein kinase n=1 Tax=Mycobacterium sp. 663a-19 TaxID=2986148 RepID=UPI002D1ED8B0|nr:serine/threonine protein kinase [Mycobacterium sp. 663a-19]MEB3984080.1 serine/threonine protein kinase [Mycobacterium sp. 663a-19]
MSPLTHALRAAAAVALMGGSALAGSATASADPTGSSADVNTLASALSKGYGLNNCQSAPLTGSVVAELDCGQNPDSSGPAAGVYQLFKNSTDVASAFSDGLGGVSLVACGDSGKSPTTWSQSGKTAGQVACGTYKNAAVITWTTDAKNVLSHIRASNTDVNALYQWWQTNG